MQKTLTGSPGGSLTAGLQLSLGVNLACDRQPIHEGSIMEAQKEKTMLLKVTANGTRWCLVAITRLTKSSPGRVTQVACLGFRLAKNPESVYS
jgi:hypothetical protein